MNNTIAITAATTIIITIAAWNLLQAIFQASKMELPIDLGDSSYNPQLEELWNLGLIESNAHVHPGAYDSFRQTDKAEDIFTLAINNNPYAVDRYNANDATLVPWATRDAA